MELITKHDMNFPQIGFRDQTQKLFMRRIGAS